MRGNSVQKQHAEKGFYRNLKRTCGNCCHDIVTQ